VRERAIKRVQILATWPRVKREVRHERERKREERGIQLYFDGGGGEENLRLRTVRVLE
jgi:hypothetical protein